MGKTKTNKGRGKRTHGRGRKKGRGKGLRGGSGNAGLHKHKYTTTVKLQNEGVRVFGRYGFKRPKGTVMADATINVGELGVKFPGAATVDLGQHGFTKLLGAGEVSGKIVVTVEAASGGAVEKIQAAGGSVTTSRVKAVRKPPAPAKGAPAPAKGAPAPAKVESKPAPKPENKPPVKPKA